MAESKLHPSAFLGAVAELERSLTAQSRRTKAAIYARVSTANSGQDLTMQTCELEEYCQRRGWKLAGVYIDLGVSGSKESRPELDRLMTDARRRRLDVVAVWKFDRFARSVSHLLKALDTFRAVVDAARVARARSQGQSWAAISREFGVGAGTVRRAYAGLAKIPSPAATVSR